MIRLEMPQETAGSRSSKTVKISGVTVRLVFAEEGDARAAKMVRDALKESYNNRLSA